jgi:hypothetical protein
MGSGIVVKKQYLSLPVGLEVFCELHPEASAELHSTMQNSHSLYVSKNWLTVLHENHKAL